MKLNRYLSGLFDERRYNGYGLVVTDFDAEVTDLPSYGYRRIWANLRRRSEQEGLTVTNAKRVWRVMRDNGLLLQPKPRPTPDTRRHTGRVAVAGSNRR
ncbi:hypothetical protein FD733_15735 [Pantoea sp. Eser]|nr:hypothetical protein [Pantoea sp. Eser]